MRWIWYIIWWIFLFTMTRMRWCQGFALIILFKMSKRSCRINLANWNFMLIFYIGCFTMFEWTLTIFFNLVISDKKRFTIILTLLTLIIIYNITFLFSHSTELILQESIILIFIIFLNKALFIFWCFHSRKTFKNRFSFIY